MSLLCHFKTHRAAVYNEGMAVDKVVEALPLRSLEPALFSWVCSWFQAPQALISTYALHAADFILAHAYGVSKFTQSRLWWKIAPMLPPELADRPHTFRNDPSFKRELTAAIRGTMAVVRVPPRGHCLESGSQTIVLHPGDEFIVEIMRCHTSTSLDDWPAFDVVDDDEPELSLSLDFEIPCEFWARHRGGEEAFYLPKLDGPRLRLKIPGRWLVGVLDRSGWKDPWVPVSLPDWLVG